MKRQTQVIDTQDDLHDAVERSVAGLTPEQRAKRLIEMFGKPAQSAPAATPSGSYVEQMMERYPGISREEAQAMLDIHGF